jgi:hypothetical protein
MCPAGIFKYREFKYDQTPSQREISVGAQPANSVDKSPSISYSPDNSELFRKIKGG